MKISECRESNRRARWGPMSREYVNQRTWGERLLQERRYARGEPRGNRESTGREF